MLKKIEDIIGQDKLIKNNGPLKKMIDNNNFASFVLYGSSGIGKTTIANIIATYTKKTSFNLNAVKTTKKEFEEVLFNYQNQELLIIVDEVHRLDKIKQNLFLPYLEKENIMLIGTTTENPTYHLHSAFRSRVLIFPLEEINFQQLFDYLQKYNLVKFPQNILGEKVIQNIVLASGNDIRKSLQFFNFIVNNYPKKELTAEILQTILQANIRHQSKQDEHYDLISAFQKSIRASAVNAALFYLAKLLLIGNYEILFRRLAIIAYEDIGLANPSLVTKVLNAIELFKTIGMPEGRIILANIIIELALSPKSITAYQALDEAIADVKRYPNATIPLNIRQNQDENNKYSKEQAFYQNLLPQEVKNSEYVKFQTNSRYETKLYEQYEKLKKLKNKE
ncbi:MAG: AAA family ATPase [Mycoplasmatales bacterium]